MSRFELTGLHDPKELVADGLMSVPDAVEFTGLGRSTLYNLMDAGKLAYVKVGRARRIPKRELVEFLASNLIQRRVS